MSTGQELPGARLQLPRDLRFLYALGRMGASTLEPLWKLNYGSPHTQRGGIRRLEKLGLVRSFPRIAPSLPKWWALTRRGYEWVIEQTGCEENELRWVTGLGRVNLAALHARNHAWSSIILATRQTPAVKLILFRPEWELRRLAGSVVPVVPDFQMVLAPASDATATVAFMAEQDAGTERLSVWRAKAVAYRMLRQGGQLYGASRWFTLTLVPSLRRARTIATAVASEGAGDFIYLAVEEALREGRAFDRVLWLASELAERAGPARHSLVDLVGVAGMPISEAEQR